MATSRSMEKVWNYVLAEKVVTTWKVARATSLSHSTCKRCLRALVSYGEVSVREFEHRPGIMAYEYSVVPGVSNDR